MKINTASPDDILEIEFDPNVDIEFGQGVTDPNTSFFTLTRNVSGTQVKRYIFLNAAGDGLTVSATKP